MTANRIDTPRVFISYCWTSTTHQNWVLELAERLCSDGVDVILDKWDLKEGQDKYAFMESMVTDKNVKKVLMICDKKYKEKSDKREGGVGTESQIISVEVYNKADQIKFIPVVSEIDDKGQPYLPIFLKTRIFINLANMDNYADEYEKLLRSIFDKPLYKKPIVGIPPNYIMDEEVTPIITTGKFARVQDAILNGKHSTEAALRDYFDALIEALEIFRLSDPIDNDFDDKIVKSIERFKPYRDQFAETIKLIGSSHSSQTYYDIVFNFLENSLSYQSVPETATSWNDGWLENYRFILYELFIYLIAILLKMQKYNAVDFFLREKYFFKSRMKHEYAEFNIFYAYLRLLDESRNRRLYRGERFSVTADIIKERATLKWLPFYHIMQADFILSLRFLLNDTDDIYWFPRICVYAEYRHEGFPLFFKAQAHRHFDPVKIILNIKDKNDIIERFEKAKTARNLDQWRFGWHGVPFVQWMCLSKLDTI